MVIRTIDPELELRLLSVADAAALGTVDAGDLSELGGEWLFPPGGAMGFVQQKLAAYERGAALPTGVWLRGALVGVLYVDPIDRQNRSGSLGYALGAPFRGRGVMTRAGRGLSRTPSGSWGSTGSRSTRTRRTRRAAGSRNGWGSPARASSASGIGTAGSFATRWCMGRWRAMSRGVGLEGET